MDRALWGRTFRAGLLEQDFEGQDFAAQDIARQGFVGYDFAGQDLQKML